MRFTDKNVTVNKVIYYSYNYTILLIIINLVKSIYQSTDSLQNKIKLKLWLSVGEQIMGRFVTSLKLPGTGAWSHCPVHPAV